MMSLKIIRWTAQCVNEILTENYNVSYHIYTTLGLK